MAGVRCEQCGQRKSDAWWLPVWMRCWGHDHHKKVTDLNQLTLDEIAPEDVLLISDVSKHESKRVRVGDLVEYVRRNR